MAIDELAGVPVRRSGFPGSNRRADEERECELVEEKFFSFFYPLLCDLYDPKRLHSGSFLCVLIGLLGPDRKSHTRFARFRSPPI